MDTVQGIFREYGPDYAEQFGGRMPAEHLKVIEAVISCRTPVFGMTVYECAQCGNTHYIPRSCGNRHCPSCQHQKGPDWMDVQVKRQVPTHHFMITFTVPEKFIRSSVLISVFRIMPFSRRRPKP